jgi:hypothetical protein
MATLDTGRLIHQTQELVAESQKLHEWARQSVNKSKHLQTTVTVSVSVSRRIWRARKHRKLLLKESA